MSNHFQVDEDLKNVTTEEYSYRLFKADNAFGIGFVGHDVVVPLMIDAVRATDFGKPFDGLIREDVRKRYISVMRSKMGRILPVRKNAYTLGYTMAMAYFDDVSHRLADYARTTWTCMSEEELEEKFRKGLALLPMQHISSVYADHYYRYLCSVIKSSGTLADAKNSDAKIQEILYQATSDSKTFSLSYVLARVGRTGGLTGWVKIRNQLMADKLATDTLGLFYQGFQKPSETGAAILEGISHYKKKGLPYALEIKVAHDHMVNDEYFTARRTLMSVPPRILKEFEKIALG